MEGQKKYEEDFDGERTEKKKTLKNCRKRSI